MRIKYLDIDFRHRARVCVCVYVYVYVRVHIHIHTRTCASSRIKPRKSAIDTSIVRGLTRFDFSCLLGARARTSKQEKSTLVKSFKLRSPDDSGSKLRDKEQQRLSSK